MAAVFVVFGGRDCCCRNASRGSSCAYREGRGVLFFGLEGGGRRKLLLRLRRRRPGPGAGGVVDSSDLAPPPPPMMLPLLTLLPPLILVGGVGDDWFNRREWKRASMVELIILLRC